METLTLNLPAMYGDHHVIEVRNILLALPGIEEVYASSCFHVVQVKYDPAHIDPNAISARLEEAGYLQDLEVPVETGDIAYSQDGKQKFFRHTAAYQQTRQVVSFAQRVSYSGRPLWPCPGMGALRQPDDK